MLSNDVKIKNLAKAIANPYFLSKRVGDVAKIDVDADAKAIDGLIDAVDFSDAAAPDTLDAKIASFIAVFNTQVSLSLQIIAPFPADVDALKGLLETRLGLMDCLQQLNTLVNNPLLSYDYRNTFDALKSQIQNYFSLDNNKDLALLFKTFPSIIENARIETFFGELYANRIDRRCNIFADQIKDIVENIAEEKFDFNAQCAALDTLLKEEKVDFSANVGIEATLKTKIAAALDANDPAMIIFNLDSWEPKNADELRQGFYAALFLKTSRGLIAYSENPALNVLGFETLALLHKRLLHNKDEMTAECLANLEIRTAIWATLNLNPPLAVPAAADFYAEFIEQLNIKIVDNCLNNSVLALLKTQPPQEAEAKALLASIAAVPALKAKLDDRSKRQAVAEQVAKGWPVAVPAVPAVALVAADDFSGFKALALQDFEYFTKFDYADPFDLLAVARRKLLAELPIHEQMLYAIEFNRLNQDAGYPLPHGAIAIDRIADASYTVEQYHEWLKDFHYIPCMLTLYFDGAYIKKGVFTELQTQEFAKITLFIAAFEWGVEEITFLNTSINKIIDALPGDAADHAELKAIFSNGGLPVDHDGVIAKLKAIQEKIKEKTLLTLGAEIIAMPHPLLATALDEKATAADVTTAVTELDTKLQEFFGAGVTIHLSDDELKAIEGMLGIDNINDPALASPLTQEILFSRIKARMADVVLANMFTGALFLGPADSAAITAEFDKGCRAVDRLLSLVDLAKPDEQAAVVNGLSNNIPLTAQLAAVRDPADLTDAELIKAALMIEYIKNALAAIDNGNITDHAMIATIYAEIAKILQDDKRLLAPADRLFATPSVIELFKATLPQFAASSDLLVTFNGFKDLHTAPVGGGGGSAPAVAIIAEAKAVVETIVDLNAVPDFTIDLVTWYANSERAPNNLVVRCTNHVEVDFVIAQLRSQVAVHPHVANPEFADFIAGLNAIAPQAAVGALDNLTERTDQLNRLLIGDFNLQLLRQKVLRQDHRDAVFVSKTDFDNKLGEDTVFTAFAAESKALFHEIRIDDDDKNLPAFYDSADVKVSQPKRAAFCNAVLTGIDQKQGTDPVVFDDKTEMSVNFSRRLQNSEHHVDACMKAIQRIGTHTNALIARFSNADLDDPAMLQQHNIDSLLAMQWLPDISEAAAWTPALKKRFYGIIQLVKQNDANSPFVRFSSAFPTNSALITPALIKQELLAQLAAAFIEALRKNTKSPYTDQKTKNVIHLIKQIDAITDPDLKAKVGELLLADKELNVLLTGADAKIDPDIIKPGHEAERKQNMAAGVFHRYVRDVRSQYGFDRYAAAIGHGKTLMEQLDLTTLRKQAINPSWVAASGEAEFFKDIVEAEAFWNHYLKTFAPDEILHLFKEAVRDPANKADVEAAINAIPDAFINNDADRQTLIDALVAQGFGFAMVPPFDATMAATPAAFKTYLKDTALKAVIDKHTNALLAPQVSAANEIREMFISLKNNTLNINDPTGLASQAHLLSRLANLGLDDKAKRAAFYNEILMPILLADNSLAIDIKTLKAYEAMATGADADNNALPLIQAIKQAASKHALVQWLGILAEKLDGIDSAQARLKLSRLERFVNVTVVRDHLLQMVELDDVSVANLATSMRIDVGMTTGLDAITLIARAIASNAQERVAYIAKHYSTASSSSVSLLIRTDGSAPAAALRTFLPVPYPGSSDFSRVIQESPHSVTQTKSAEALANLFKGRVTQLEADQKCMSDELKCIQKYTHPTGAPVVATELAVEKRLVAIDEQFYDTTVDEKTPKVIHNPFAPHVAVLPTISRASHLTEMKDSVDAIYKAGLSPEARRKAIEAALQKIKDLRVCYVAKIKGLEKNTLGVFSDPIPYRIAERQLHASMSQLETRLLTLSLEMEAHVAAETTTSGKNDLGRELTDQFQTISSQLSDEIRAPSALLNWDSCLDESRKIVADRMRLVVRDAGMKEALVALQTAPSVPATTNSLNNATATLQKKVFGPAIDVLRSPEAKAFIATQSVTSMRQVTVERQLDTTKFVTCLPMIGSQTSAQYRATVSTRERDKLSVAGFTEQYERASKGDKKKIAKAFIVYLTEIAKSGCFNDSGPELLISGSSAVLAEITKQVLEQPGMLAPFKGKAVIVTLEKGNVKADSSMTEKDISTFAKECIKEVNKEKAEAAKPKTSFFAKSKPTDVTKTVATVAMRAP